MEVQLGRWMATARAAGIPPVATELVRGLVGRWGWGLLAGVAMGRERAAAEVRGTAKGKASAKRNTTGPDYGVMSCPCRALRRAKTVAGTYCGTVMHARTGEREGEGEGDGDVGQGGRSDNTSVALTTYPGFKYRASPSVS